MKILFAGTPEIAVPSLDKLHGCSEIVGVLTAPDTRKGRGKQLRRSPVKEKALELGLKVLQPSRLRREAREEIALLEAELLVVFAYGRIFGPKFLSLFPRGAINVHPSLLPRYRGSAPIVAPILNGDDETGVTVQSVALEVDSGEILGRRRFPLKGDETAGSLSSLMAEEGADLLVEVVSDIEADTVSSEKQDERLVTLCRRLSKRDGLINWSLPASMIERMVRAYTPWPKAYTYWGGKRLTILEAVSIDGDEAEGKGEDAAKGKVPGEVLGMDREVGFLVQTGMGLLGVHRLQLEGKRPLDSGEFLNGNRDFPEAHLGADE